MVQAQLSGQRAVIYLFLSLFWWPALAQPSLLFPRQMSFCAALLTAPELQTTATGHSLEHTLNRIEAVTGNTEADLFSLPALDDPETGSIAKMRKLGVAVSDLRIRREFAGQKDILDFLNGVGQAAFDLDAAMAKPGQAPFSFWTKERKARAMSLSAAFATAHLLTLWFVQSAVTSPNLDNGILALSGTAVFSRTALYAWKKLIPLLKAIKDPEQRTQFLNRDPDRTYGLFMFMDMVAELAQRPPVLKFELGPRFAIGIPDDLAKLLKDPPLPDAHKQELENYERLLHTALAQALRDYDPSVQTHPHNAFILNMNYYSDPQIGPRLLAEFRIIQSQAGGDLRNRRTEKEKKKIEEFLPGLLPTPTF